MTWQEEMQAAAREVIKRDAVPCEPNASQYGWKDYAAQYHLSGGGGMDEWVVRHGLPVGPCELILDGAVRELAWSEFEGTVNENSDHVGIESSGHCACGAWSGTIRYEGTLGEVINRLLEEAVTITVHDDPDSFCDAMGIPHFPKKEA